MSWLKAMSKHTLKDLMLKYPELRTLLARYFTIIFEDGFETGDYSAWTGTVVDPGVTLEVSTEQAHHGTYSSKVVIPPGQATYSWGCSYYQFSNMTTFYYRFYVYITQFPLEWNLIASAHEAGFYNEQCRFEIEDVYMRIRYRDAGTSVYGTPFEHGMALNTWHCLEGHVFRDAVNGEARVWIDGIEKWSVTGLSNDDKPLTEIRIGVQNLGDRPMTIYYDCVAVADTYIGPEIPLPVPGVKAMFGGFYLVFPA